MEVLFEVKSRKQLDSRLPHVKLNKKSFIQLIKIDIVHICMIWTAFFSFVVNFGTSSIGDNRVE